MGARRVFRLFGLLVFAGAIAAPALGQETGNDSEPVSTSLTDALTGGKAHFNFRYRYEFVDQDFNRASGEPFTEDAHASTLRIRLNYQTGSWKDWSGFGEFDYVGEVFLKDFNNTVDPGRGQYPVVADPKGADFNQFYLDWDGLSDSKFRFGRQRIVLDNQRFVGGVAWRQHEQTFDSVSGRFKGIPRTELFYSYVGRVNRIFGERSAIGTDDTDTHLLNAGIELAGDWKLVPYIYYIDSDDIPAFSTSTAGVRATGKLKIGDGSLALVGEFASQTDAGSAPVDFSAQYYHLDAMWSIGNGLGIGIGAESLGGDNTTPGKAFRTPLATLHKFQGWADQFLVTPNAGVDDLYVKLAYQTGKWNFLGVYHDFSAQSGSANWGSEVDAQAARKLGDRYSVLFKGAWFRADNSSFSDVTKFWIMLNADF